MPEPHACTGDRAHSQGGQGPAPSRSAYDPRGQRSPALVLLIVAGISTLVGLVTSVPALVLAVLALLSQHKAPSRAAVLTRWGWIAYAAGALLLVLFGVVLVVVAGYAASGND